MNRLTLSLDYTWNEKGVIKKKQRDDDKTIKRQNELSYMEAKKKMTFVVYLHKIKRESGGNKNVIG